MLLQKVLVFTKKKHFFAIFFLDFSVSLFIWIESLYFSFRNFLWNNLILIQKIVNQIEQIIFFSNMFV